MSTPLSRRPLLFLRASVTLQALLLLVQSGLAGGFIGGHYDLLQAHSIVARAVIVVSVLTAVAAFLVRRAGGPARPFVMAAVLVAAGAGEFALGETRLVAPHVLLGVIVVSGTAVLASKAWTGPPKRPAGAPGATPRREEVSA